MVEEVQLVARFSLVRNELAAILFSDHTDDISFSEMWRAGRAETGILEGHSKVTDLVVKVITDW